MIIKSFFTECGIPYVDDVFFPSSPIDGSTSLPTGETFDDPMSLKKALLGKSDLLAKSLAEKLLTYGAGRNPTLADEEEIKQIAKTVNDGEFGFRNLVIKVATSQAFQRK